MAGFSLAYEKDDLTMGEVATCNLGAGGREARGHYLMKRSHLIIRIFLHCCRINIPGFQYKPLSPGQECETIWSGKMKTASDHQDRIPSSTYGRGLG